MEIDAEVDEKTQIRIAGRDDLDGHEEMVEGKHGPKRRKERQSAAGSKRTRPLVNRKAKMGTKGPTIATQLLVVISYSIEKVSLTLPLPEAQGEPSSDAGA